MTTAEVDRLICRVCGAADHVEPSPITGDAVCPRCGGCLDQLLPGFADLFVGQSRPVSLATGLEVHPDYDSFDIAERMLDLEQHLGVRVDLDELRECETLADLVRYLSRLPDETPGGT